MYNTAAEVLLANTIKFHPQTQKVGTAFIHVFMTDAGSLRVNGTYFGFVFRWKVIADYVNMHSKTGTERDSKHVIKKVKNLKKLGLRHACFILFPCKLSGFNLVPARLLSYSSLRSDG